MHALQIGISAFGKDASCKPYLMRLLEEVEKVCCHAPLIHQLKAELRGSEAIVDNIVGQVRLLSYGAKATVVLAVVELFMMMSICGS